MMLVIGATGNIGSEVVNQLSEKGQKVRALSRRPEKVTWPPNVEAVQGDLNDSTRTRNLLSDVDKIFLVLVPGGDGGVDSLLEAAKEAGVEHVVFLSSNSIESGVDNEIGEFHLRVEEAVDRSGVPWTFLRAADLMSNALQWRSSVTSECVVKAPFGDVKVPAIDPKDIAAVAAEALLSAGHEGCVYTLTGPEMVSPEDQAEILGQVLDQPIGFEELSESTAREGMAHALPEDIVEGEIKLKKEARIHPFGVRSTVEDVTGVKPSDFRKWANDHIDQFR